MGDKSEDILFQAHGEGIPLKKLYAESRKVSKKYPHMEVGDRYEIAYNNIKIKNDGKKK
tara:strand:+ start:945 stop:1121 length:177 start_codon:yes stop_codon:yes gene_type:complete